MTNCVPMSSITLKGSTTQNAGIRLSAISARYNLKIYYVLNECICEIGGMPEVYISSYETLADVTARLTLLIEYVYNAKHTHAVFGYVSFKQFKNKIANR